MQSDFVSSTIAVFVVIGLPIAIYSLFLFNDLAKRLERLKGVAADIRSARARRWGISHVAGQGVQSATAHEQRVVRSGSRRGGRGNGQFSVRDNANGWADVKAVNTVSQGLAANIQAQDFENQVRQSLHREAEEFNARLRVFPACILAPLMGFKPWNLGGGQGDSRKQPGRQVKRRR